MGETIEFRAKAFHYPGRVVEVVSWRHRPMGDPRLCRPEKPRSLMDEAELRERERKDLMNRQRAARRRRTVLRRLALVRRYDVMLTLNTRQLENDLSGLVTAFREFRRLVRRQFPDFEYSAVPELHPVAEAEGRHHWHIHLACCADAFGLGRSGRKWVPILGLRTLWLRALARTLGCDGAVNVSPQSLKNLRAGRSDPLRLAGYLAKYLGKLGDGEGRLLWNSKGEKPVPILYSLSARSYDEMVEELLLGDPDLVPIRSSSFVEDWNESRNFWWVMYRIRGSA